MNSEHDIQRYLEGNLKGKELKLFKIRLKDEADFKALFLDYEKAWKLIEKQYKKLKMSERLKERSGIAKQAMSIEDISQEVADSIHGNETDSIDEKRLRQIIQIFMRKAPGNKRKIGFILALAASLILLTGLRISFNINRDFRTNSDLYEQYYSAYPYLLNERGIKITNYEVRRAMILYNNHNYQATASILERYPSDSINYPFPGLYLGICEMEMKKFYQAIRIFENIKSVNHDLTYNQVNWYMGLCYLKLNKRTMAIERFGELETDSCLYTPQARDILRKLKNY